MVSTDELACENLGKRHTTVAVDFGLLTLENIPFHLFSTPGQDRFDFPWEILCKVVCFKAVIVGRRVRVLAAVISLR